MCSVHNCNYHTSSSSSTAVTTLTSGITTTHDWFSRFLHTSQQNTYTLQWAALSPSKLPLPCRIWALSNGTRFVGPTQATAQTTSRSVQLFLQGSQPWRTDRPTDRPRHSVCIISDIAIFVLKRDVKLQPTNKPTNSVCNNRPHLHCTVSLWCELIITVHISSI